MSTSARIKRLYSRAEELFRLLEQRLNSDEDLNNPRTAVHEIAASLDESFAKEILLCAWSISLHHEGIPRKVRPGLKNALIAVESQAKGSSRSVGRVAELVTACLLEQFSLFEHVEPMWTSTTPGREVALSVSGSTLQTTPFAQQLVSENILDSLRFSAQQVAGISTAIHPSKVVTGFSQRIASHRHAATFWKGIYVRLAVAMLALEAREPEGHDLCFIPNSAYIQNHSHHGPNAFIGLNAADLTDTLCFTESVGHGDIDLITHPMLKVTGGFMTSSRLVLDSIAPFSLKWLHEHDAWTQVISQPFEERVTQRLREIDLLAGAVQKTGYWDAQRGDDYIQSCFDRHKDSCPGEIDIVASDGRQLILVECKSLYPFSNFRNLTGRVSDEDISGWISNALRKKRWLEESTGLPVGFTTIVVEGMQYFDSEAGEQPVPVLDYDTFETLIEAIDEEDG